ncbi:MAG: F0F1 ATP synthase subunit B [Magnetococcales bacterium]|nr:F0F1 ATP synthase subunit B [Magnetococcales bacterium]MBF0414695.1 F0F1 ATP synthase subunit B [Magnetococcales bacterium]MBF0419077.1 F0F1 ATP synthase subunit B [Magnetococcales bacterium]
MNINLTLFSQAFAFGIFIWFTVKFVWPPLLKAIEDRQKYIAEGLAAADEGRKSLDQAQDRVGVIEAEARSKAVDIITAHEKRAAQIIDNAKERAKVEAERIITHARETAEIETAKAKDALRREVGRLAVLGAERILRREIDPKAHTELLNQLRDEL